MPSAIVVGTNSWCTLAEAEAYFATRINRAPWTALGSDANKEMYLITAYRWIRYDSAFQVTGKETYDSVKFGQCEAALFLASYASEYDKRDAMQAMGVTEFEYSKWTETLGELKKPKTVFDFFSAEGLYSGGIAVITLTDPNTFY